MDLLPNELGNIVKDYAIFKPNNYDELKEAVDLWCIDRGKALPIYGHISVWDTSLITDMSNLFENKTDFNDNINNWNVSSVTDMCFMFANASLFNQPLNSWDVSSVTDMKDMFEGASSFNQPLNSWNVSSVINMACMFNGASSFNQPLDSWDVSSVTHMAFMFNRTTSFNHNYFFQNQYFRIRFENNMLKMFEGASSFNRDDALWYKFN